MLILAQTTTKRLIPYTGNDTPVIQIILLLGILAVTGSVITVIVLKYLKNKKFVELCNSYELSGEERGFIQSYLQRFHMTLDPGLLSQKRRWDRFCNSIAHQMEAEKISEENIEGQAEPLDSIRKKLNLEHTMKQKEITSSRSLTKEYPLTISYNQAETGKKITFEASVFANNDLFLFFKPVDEYKDQQLFLQKKPSLEVSFARDGDSEYHFKTLLIQAINYSDPIWCVRHSVDLKKSSSEKALGIPASLMLQLEEEKDSSEIEEYQALIHSICSTDCTFTIDPNVTPLKSNQGFLLNFEDDTNSFCWGGTVTKKTKGKKEVFYRSEFKNITPEESLQLAQFLKNLKNKQHPSKTNV